MRNLKKSYLLILCLLLIAFPRQAKAVTEADLVTKLGQVLDKQEAVYPLSSLPGDDVDGDGTADTLASLDQKYAAQSPEIQAEWRAKLFAPPKPAVSDTNLEDWAQWHKRMQAGHTILFRHYLYQYLAHGQSDFDKQRLITHLYMIATHLDTATTGPETNPIFPITLNPDPPATYKLRDTFFFARYLPDGSGIYQALGWAQSLGLVPRFYCTPLQTPYDPGKSCKTINLWEGIRRVSAAVTTKVASEWLIHSDGTLKTEYWDNTPYWAAWNSDGGGGSYSMTPNTLYNPSAGIGWPDLVGRRTMQVSPLAQQMSPGFYLSQVAGMADAAKIVINEGGIYQTAHDFGTAATVWQHSLTNRTSDNAQLNSYGKPVRGFLNQCGAGALVSPSANNPLDICQGGISEWFQYPRAWYISSSLPQLPNHTEAAYNGQHVGAVLNTLPQNQSLPQVFLDNALNFYYMYKANFYKDSDSYLDFTNGGFKESTINKYSTGQIGPCGQPALYTKASSGRIGTLSGETAAELVSSMAAPMYSIIATKDTAKAQEILNDTDALLTDLVTNPLRPEDQCGSPGWLNRNTFVKSAWQRNNLLLGYFSFLHAAIGTYPKVWDINADQQVDISDFSQLTADFGKSGSPGVTASDLDMDGKITIFDFNLLVTNFGLPVAPPLSLPLPSSSPSVIQCAHQHKCSPAGTGWTIDYIPTDATCMVTDNGGAPATSCPGSWTNGCTVGTTTCTCRIYKTCCTTALGQAGLDCQ